MVCEECGKEVSVNNPCGLRVHYHRKHKELNSTGTTTTVKKLNNGDGAGTSSQGRKSLVPNPIPNSRQGPPRMIDVEVQTVANEKGSAPKAPDSPNAGIGAPEFNLWSLELERIVKRVRKLKKTKNVDLHEVIITIKAVLDEHLENPNVEFDRNTMIKRKIN